MQNRVVGVPTWGLVLGLVLVVALGQGCGKQGDQEAGAAAEESHVLVAVDCLVGHSGYESVIVAPGIAKPVTGTAVSLECNGKPVELADGTFDDGFIETKMFGKIGVRFGSMVATVGAGDFISLPEGRTTKARAVEVLVPRSKQQDFMALIAE